MQLDSLLMQVDNGYAHINVVVWPSLFLKQILQTFTLTFPNEILEQGTWFNSGGSQKGISRRKLCTISPQQHVRVWKNKHSLEQLQSLGRDI